MGKDAVVKLLTDVSEGSALRNELDAAVEASGERADGFLKVAAKHGYEFTPAEFKEVLAEASAPSQERELSDEDLDQVAGGVGFIQFPRQNLSWAFRVSPRIDRLHAPPPEFVGGGGF